VASPVTTKGDLIVGQDNTGTLGRLGVGSDGQVPIADAASAGGIKWSTITTSAWPLSGTGTFTAPVTIAQGTSALDYTTTLGIASSSVFQQITNNTNVLYQLTTQGFPTWNLYSSSAKIGSVLFVSSGGAGAGIRLQDATAATRYNILQNVTGNYLSISENTVTNTKVFIGAGPGVTPAATLQVRGSGTGATDAFRVEDSSTTARFDVQNNGDTRISGTLNVGANAQSNSTLQVTGSFSAAYVAKTALYTLTSSDYIVEVTSGTHTQTLPTAVGITGRHYIITNSGTGVVTVGTTSSQTFVNVSATPTTLTLNQFQTVTVVSNGANWLRVSTI
jgi:hypothetical protein